MASKLEVFLVVIVVILVALWGYSFFTFNSKIVQIEEEYALKNQVSQMVFDRIDQCTVVRVTKEKWSYDSDDIYAREVCDSIEKSCLTATANYMEAAPAWNVFSKGNLGCGMPLFRNMLQTLAEVGSPSEAGLASNYEVVCC
jgi:hypothetical protein